MFMSYPSQIPFTHTLLAMIRLICSSPSYREVIQLGWMYFMYALDCAVYRRRHQYDESNLLLGTTATWHSLWVLQPPGWLLALVWLLDGSWFTRSKQGIYLASKVR